MPGSSAKKKASSATSKSSRRKKPAIEGEGKRCDSCNRWKKLPRFRLLADKAPRVHADTCLICEAKQGDIPDDPKEFKHQKIRRNFDVERKAKIRQELAYRELCRRRLLTYVQRYEPSYLAGWVHLKVAAKLEEFLEKAVRGDAPRLMLFLPPRHGKSMLASDYFVSWGLGKYPWLEFISTSHSSGLPIKASRRIRSRLQHQSHQAIFEDTKIAHDSRNVEHWNTTANGGFLAAGVGGGITGHGAHIFIIDDPVKDAEEADSETVRENHWDWWSSTASTRVAPGGGVLYIACMTGDTSVSMADGRRVRLDEVRPGDRVLSREGDSLTSRRVLNWAPQGEDEVFEIRTGNSRVRANARHPFLVRSAKGHYRWVRTDELATLGYNNYLVQTGSEPVEEDPACLTQRQAHLLGFMFGDGWVTRRDSTNYDRARDTYYPRRGYVTCVARGVDEALNSRVLEAFKEEFGVTLKLTAHGYYRTDTQRVGRWLVGNGLVGTAKAKEIPDWVFSQPLAVRRAFLEGFVDADGCIGANNRVQVKLCSYSLAAQVRDLARSVGLRPSNLHVRTGMAQAPNSPVPIEATAVDVQWQREYEGNPFYFRRIRSIRPAGREMVYDIQVEDTENFIADGLVTHNTRWHDDDLGGRMLSQEREAIAEGIPREELENWEVISFPALAEEDEYELPDGTFLGAEGENYPQAKLIRYREEALHRERWPEEFLRRKRRTMQPRHWSALYQQNPVPDEGINFTKDMFITQAPRIGGHHPMTLISAWDLAIGQKQHNDWTVGVVGGLDRKSNLHVLDMVRGRWGTMQIVEAILDMYMKYPEMQRLGIEKGQLELAIKQPLEARMEERRLWPVLDKTLNPIQDKEKRAGPLQGMMQNHRVLFPPERDHPWVTRIREELLRFPAGVHDDTVDALAWLARMAYQTSPPQEPAKPRFVSWKENLKYHVEGAGSKDPMAV